MLKKSFMGHSGGSSGLQVPKQQPKGFGSGGTVHEASERSRVSIENWVFREGGGGE